jgi:hypothetical protein
VFAILMSIRYICEDIKRHQRDKRFKLITTSMDQDYLSFYLLSS